MTGRTGWMITLVAVAAVVRVGAHKPVTSKYTYWEDVQPIVKEHCGGCHVPGGIAPMSLMTYEDARPWAESIRLELTSGHMPPWYGDPSVAPLRDVHKLTPRELDVILTWVTGGTPPGPSTGKPATNATRRGWLKGRPDITLPLPAAVSLAADKPEDTREFVLRETNDRDRVIAFADLLPGNSSIVHDATIFTRRPGSAEPSVVVAVWIPGVAPTVPGVGVGFPWRAGEQLVARIHYKKNWKLENKAASDRSTVGLYLAKGTARPIRDLTLGTGDPLVIGETLQALAVRAAAGQPDARVVVSAVRPDGGRVPIAGFVARTGWDQRYWLLRPVDLPKGSRVEVKSGGAQVRLALDVLP